MQHDGFQQEHERFPRVVPPQQLLRGQVKVVGEPKEFGGRGVAHGRQLLKVLVEQGERFEGREVDLGRRRKPHLVLHVGDEEREADGDADHVFVRVPEHVLHDLGPVVHHVLGPFLAN